jgi:hypothetical protein
MGNRILGRSSTIYGLLLLFLRINNIMLFFVCQVWNVTLKKTNEWRENKEKSGRKFARAERKLRKIEGGNRTGIFLMR